MAGLIGSVGALVALIVLVALFSQIRPIPEWLLKADPGDQKRRTLFLFWYRRRSWSA